MEEQIEEKTCDVVDVVNAGRGIAQSKNLDSNKNTTLNQEDENERADDRARKAGC